MSRFHFANPYAKLDELADTKLDAAACEGEDEDAIAAMDRVCGGEVRAHILARIERILSEFRDDSTYGPRDRVAKTYGGGVYKGIGGVSILLLRLSDVVDEHKDVAAAVRRGLHVAESQDLRKALLEQGLKFNDVAMARVERFVLNLLFGRRLCLPTLLFGRAGILAIRAALLERLVLCSLITRKRHPA